MLVVPSGPCVTVEPLAALSLALLLDQGRRDRRGSKMLSKRGSELAPVGSGLKA